MKIGFISPAVPGHFNPMSALARQLQSRNHDVVIFSAPAVEPQARAANLPFVPFGEKEFTVDKAAEIIRTMSRLKGEENLQFGAVTRSACGRPSNDTWLYPLGTIVGAPRCSGPCRRPVACHRRVGHGFFPSTHHSRPRLGPRQCNTADLFRRRIESASLRFR